ncbi:hypothetical protein FOH24_08800 [Acetobacter tropicalis]|nr:hypothetical protein [Acetobacter tropicalis]KAA8389639.1 hypothetical protein FOH22_06385 [Acetobacter tropicalis]KAA8390439.1 hypothetical protein FOH24_08800 [Acetobacter tropicalis]MDO8173273.1 hypothetical protein [Acetobacter tropicalis]
MSIDKIKIQLARQLEEPVLQVCLNIVDHLSRVSFDQAQRLTFTLLYNWSESDVDESTFYAALTALTSMKNRPLVMYFVFHDENEDREIAISAKDAMKAAKENEFYNPETGEEIDDFLKKLFPVYKMTEFFAAAAKKQ